MKTRLILTAMAMFVLHTVFGQGVFFEKTVALKMKNISTVEKKRDTTETKVPKGQDSILVRTVTIHKKDITAKEETTNLTIRVEKYSNKYTIYLNDSSFVIYGFDYNAFNTGIKELLKHKLQKDIANDDQISNLYDRIKDADTMEKEAPVAGELIVKKEVGFNTFNARNEEKSFFKKIFFWKRTKKTKYFVGELICGNERDGSIRLIDSIKSPNKFKINHYTIKIQNGIIQNIFLYGTIIIEKNKKYKNYKDPIVLQNKVPIGFSTLRDYRSLSKYYLIIMDGKYKGTKIQLDSFIEYIPQLRNNTRDYAPYDIVINRELPGSEKIDTISLRKEPSKKILDAKVFTDLMAYSGENPNGIIQFEVEKRMSFNTRRHSLSWRAKQKSNANIGLFQYIKPKGVYSKIENTNKYLELKIDNTDLTTNIIELYKHEKYRVGTDLNLFIIDAGKSNITLDIGVAFSRIICTNTSSDSTSQANKIPVNSIHSYGKAGFDLMPDERYGMSVSYTVGLYNPLNTNIYYEPVNIGIDANKFWMQNVELLAFVKAGANGKMFFRYRLTGPAFDFYNNYSQIQVGYSWDIMSKINSEYNKK